MYVCVHVYSWIAHPPKQPALKFEPRTCVHSEGSFSILSAQANDWFDLLHVTVCT